MHGRPFLGHESTSGGRHKCSLTPDRRLALCFLPASCVSPPLPLTRSCHNFPFGKRLLLLLRKEIVIFEHAMDCLPDRCLQTILSFCSVREVLLICRLVSKRWREAVAGDLSQRKSLRIQQNMLRGRRESTITDANTLIVPMDESERRAVTASLAQMTSVRTLIVTRSQEKRDADKELDPDLFSLVLALSGNLKHLRLGRQQMPAADLVFDHLVELRCGGFDGLPVCPSLESVKLDRATRALLTQLPRAQLRRVHLVFSEENAFDDSHIHILERMSVLEDLRLVWCRATRVPLHLVLPLFHCFSKLVHIQMDCKLICPSAAHVDQAVSTLLLTNPSLDRMELTFCNSSDGSLITPTRKIGLQS